MEASAIKARVTAPLGGRSTRARAADPAFKWLLTVLAALILVLIAFFFIFLAGKAEPAFSKFGIFGFIFDNDWNVSKSVYGALPLSWNIADKVLVMAEWDNIRNFYDSRFNSGLRVFVTTHFQVDFAVRAIGQGGSFINGDSRGPERIVQLRYSNSF